MNLVQFLSSLSRIMTFKSTKVVNDMAYSRSRIWNVTTLFTTFAHFHLVSQPTMQICR